jgi:hypothetical protein
MLGIFLSASPAAQAGVYQYAEAIVSDKNVAQSIFGVTGPDITQDILADLTNITQPVGSPHGHSTVAVGRFGAVGIDLSAVGLARDFTSPNNHVGAVVIIGSDEFVNVTGSTQGVLANAIVDGGTLRMVASTNMVMQYSLSVGLYDLGNVPIETNQAMAAFNAQLAAGQGFLKEQSGTLVSDANLHTTFSTAHGGLDATYDPFTLTVTIPISGQTFDLGTVGPNDRFEVGYEFAIDVGPVQGHDGDIEIATAKYSDPLNLSSGHPAFSVSFTSALEPSAGVLVLLLLSISASSRYERRPAVRH